MKKEAYRSIQEYRQLTTRIFDAVAEWQTYYGADPSLGLDIDPMTLDVDICAKTDANNPDDWILMSTLVSDAEPSADVVLDLADTFCIVR